MVGIPAPSVLLVITKIQLILVAKVKFKFRHHIIACSIYESFDDYCGLCSFDSGMPNQETPVCTACNFGLVLG